MAWERRQNPEDTVLRTAPNAGGPFDIKARHTPIPTSRNQPLRLIRIKFSRLQGYRILTVLVPLHEQGKGKGTQCYNCGLYGHIAANCRKGKGKGKGNYKGGGRVTYGQYTKGKSYGKSGYSGGKNSYGGGKGQSSWGKGGYVPLTEGECYKCG